MQIKCMHIYAFTVWVMGPPLVVAFIYQNKIILCSFLFKQALFFKAWNKVLIMSLLMHLHQENDGSTRMRMDIYILYNHI